MYNPIKFIFLGTGNFGCLENYQTNFIIQDDDHNLLVDAGDDLKFSLKSVGMTPNDIYAIYVTHGHGDHIHGLEYLGFSTYFNPKCAKPSIYGNKGLLNEIWTKALSLGMLSIQGKVMSLKDYFTPTEIEENGYFTWGRGRYDIVQSVHIMNGYAIVKSFGLMMRNLASGTTVYYSGDTQFNPNQIRDFYNEADIIINDCETTPYASGVHANFEELKTLDEPTKAKMYLVHFQDNVITNWKEWSERAKNEGFAGFIRPGETRIIKDGKLVIK